MHFHRIFQLKVGGAASDDIERIHAVRAILDAKVAFSFAKMLCFICFLYEQDLSDLLWLIYQQTKDLRAAGEVDLHMPLLCDANTGKVLFFVD